MAMHGDVSTFCRAGLSWYGVSSELETLQVMAGSYDDLQCLLLPREDREPCDEFTSGNLQCDDLTSDVQ